MKFTVLWLPETEQELAAIWLKAWDKASITQAANRLDQMLALDPENQGESRDQDRRILLEHPLGIIFRVEKDNRLVYVLTVWHFGRRP